MNENEKMTRRKIIGGLGAGLATVVAAPVFAAPGVRNSDSPPPKGLEDPTTKYPKPPFNGQSQPWPGLASQMDPRPDHGETSYKGSGRLAGRKALITGGDSGRDVPQPSHTRAKEQMLRSITFLLKNRMLVR